jgi:hypothetical protein
MKPTLNEKFIAYLVLLSGLSISAVAVYYSVVGLTAIFSAAVIPIIVMGTALEISKLVATIWLKQNWSIAPKLIKVYLISAVLVLMLITSMGIFGFLSKAHSDQNLVSGDVLAKIAVYDEKIKTSKENIDANRKALKQMDEAVDQVMGRSSDEKGADKAVAVRKSQTKERARLQSEIQAEQKTIASLNEERAPIAADVRKVEAEVGPLKYIAAFVYGSTDPTILEKAVTWVIITLIVVFDPLAIILLLASQISFQNFRKREQDLQEETTVVLPVVPMPPTEIDPDSLFEQLRESNLKVEEPQKPIDIVTPESAITCYKCGTELIDAPGIGLFCPNKECDVADDLVEDPQLPLDFNQPKYEFVEELHEPDYPQDDGPLTNEQVTQIEESVIVPEKPNVDLIAQYGYSTDGNGLYKVGDMTYTQEEFDKLRNQHDGYVQNEEQKDSGLWQKVISEQEYRIKAEQNLKNEPNNNTNNPA